MKIKSTTLGLILSACFFSAYNLSFAVEPDCSQRPICFKPLTELGDFWKTCKDCTIGFSPDKTSCTLSCSCFNRQTYVPAQLTLASSDALSASHCHDDCMPETVANQNGSLTCRPWS